jgi:6-phosphofructokinase 1
MIEGGSSFRKLEWSDVKEIIAKGGTVIGSARSTEFRTKVGRKKAVKNLITHNINNLIVIGGDGSLTGADFLRFVLFFLF